MSDNEHEMSGDKWVEAQSWSHVDLLEFLRPAFWALLVFMVIPRWWDNHSLTLATLNGQELDKMDKNRTGIDRNKQE